MTELACLAVDRFRTSIERRLGLRFDDTRNGFLDEVLRRRADAHDLDVSGYLERLEKSGAAPEELRKLAEELTIGETYFFRNIEQFDVFEAVALPARLSARSASSTLRVLSAGCASGEEPYTLAMILREQLPASAAWNIEVHGVDVNRAFLHRAAKGRYSAWSMRQTPADRQARWFQMSSREYVLSEEITAMVRFSEGNLADPATTWPEGFYDVAFCRNVLMYFAPDQARAVVARIARALAPGGYLFLGHAESLRSLSSEFHLLHSHETFYYQRRAASDPADVPVRTPEASHRPAYEAPLVALVDSADSWVETIRDAAQRIRDLVDGGPGTSSASAVAESRAPDVARALEMLGRERYVDALELVDTLRQGTPTDPELLLLQAVLLTHGGRLGEAESACRALLMVDELNAGAHYLMALCSEGGGDPVRAAEHDRVATYLDPAFAMPRLHLGLIARRRGERDAARVELGRALVLLQGEDSARLLLFAGGFGREQLVALCRAELVACGGRP